MLFIIWFLYGFIWFLYGFSNIEFLINFWKSPRINTKINAYYEH